MKRWIACSMVLMLAGCAGSSPGTDRDKDARDETTKSPDTPDEEGAGEDTPDENPQVEEDPQIVPDPVKPEPDPEPEPEPEHPTFGEWYRGWGGGGNEWARTLATDADGNVFVAGTFDGELTIGSDTVVAIPDEFDTKPDVFVASFAPDGEFRWLRSYGSIGADIPSSLLVDSDGNLYVVGFNSDEMVFDTMSLPHKGSSDVHIVSYDPQGMFRWADSFGGPYGETPRAAAINDAGQIAITGSFQGLFAAGSTTLNSMDTWSAMEVFTMRYDTRYRRVDWATAFRGFLIDTGTAVDIAENGHVVVGVSVQYDLQINDAITFDSRSDWFNAGIVKLDDTGLVEWGLEVTGEGSEEVIDVAVADDGSAYATGVFEGVAYVGTAEIINSHRGHDTWVAKVGPDGQPQWVRSFGAEAFDQPLGLAANARGIYVTGRFDGEIDFGGNVLQAVGDDFDIFVTSFEPADGTVRWARSFGGDGPDQPGGVSLDRGRGIYVAGYASGPVMFNDEMKPASGALIDAFVLRMEEF